MSSKTWFSPSILVASLFRRLFRLYQAYGPLTLPTLIYKVFGL